MIEMKTDHRPMGEIGMAVDKLLREWLQPISGYVVPMKRLNDIQQLWVWAPLRKGFFNYY